MPQPIDEWRNRNVHRHSPDTDFGATWRTSDAPDETWRLAWNTGSAELHAVNMTDATVDVLGTYRTRHDVDAAPPDWAHHALQPDGLSWVRERSRLDPTIGAYTPGTNPAVYGIVLHPDGHAEHLRDRDEVARRRTQVAPERSCAATLEVVDSRDQPVALHVVGDGGDVNPAATALWRTGWPVHGTAIVHAHDYTPLPATIVVSLADHNPEPTHHALERDDWHRDHERDYALDELSGDSDWDVER